MLDEAVDVEPDEDEDDERPPRDWEPLKRGVADLTRIATFAFFVVLFAAAVVGNWLRAQNVDPEYAYDIVLRTIRFGGTYYENGIHNKGPLEPLVYQSASWITSRDGFWYAISLYIAIAALILGFAAFRTTRVFGGNRDLAVAAGAVVFVHFTFAPSDYAGVLYARNMTTPLLAIAWVIILWERVWVDRRSTLLGVAVAGGALGLAVQTLTTTAFAATAISLTALVYARQRRPKSEQALIDGVFIGSGALVFLSAPVWYLLRGKFTEFYSGWWTYAKDMSVGTGRSLGAQLALGWDQFYAYYEKRPLAFLAVLAFVAITALDWKSATPRTRLFSLGLLGWFAGAWIELILSQRYSSHYFSVSTVPTALMIAALAGRAYTAVTANRGPIYGSFAWPLIAVLLALYLFGPKHFVDSMHDLSDFTSVHEHAVQIANNQSGDTRSVRATLDLVSKDWDPLLVWTNDPWPYLDYHRVSATRFIWKSFLTGEIYLGRTSPQYVLPHSWQWFHDDLKQTHPAAYLKSNGGNIPSDSDFQKVIDQDFKVVYPDGSIPVSYRNDVADALLRPNLTTPWHAPAAPARNDTGWKSGDGSVSYREAGGRDTDVQPIANDSCFMLSGQVASDGPPGGIVFHFDDNAGKHEHVKLDFDGDHVTSSSNNVEFHRLPSDVTTNGRTPAPFTLIVGRRAAGLVVNGQLRAAVQLPKSVRVTMESQRGIFDVTNMRTGPAPAFTGC
jgi:hypothetical protein